MSERDGWAHLYLYDGATGKVKNQITKGNWMVRGVTSVDEAARQITFMTGGINPKQDPYFVQYYRINFDGTGLTALTDADGYHTVSFSPDNKYYVDTWSRVDLAPISQLKRTSDASVVMELERGNVAPLVAAGWHAPEAFSAKGRDGKTDIYGIIIRPTNFDPAQKISGHRKHLRRAARIVRAEDVQRVPTACRRSPSSASSSCRSTAWARPTGRRRFTTWRRRT